MEERQRNSTTGWRSWAYRCSWTAAQPDDVARAQTFGRIANTPREADGRRVYSARGATLAKRYAARPPVAVFYQIWNKPLMTINGQHLISDVMALCGDATCSPACRSAPTVTGGGAGGHGNHRRQRHGRVARVAGCWRWAAAGGEGRQPLFHPPEILQRHTPRILDGAQKLCEQLEQAPEAGRK